MSAEIAASLSEVRRLLGLKPNGDELTVTYGNVPETDRELAMLTRSMMQIMVELAIQIDVPVQHVKKDNDPHNGG